VGDKRLSEPNGYAQNAKMDRTKFAAQLALFAEVCRLGSFSAAARLRSTTPSSIVRQIDALEGDLGAKLLTRSTRALAPTAAGELLLRRAQRVLDDLVDIRAEIAALDGAVGGALRVACLPTFGRRYALPALASLVKAHPTLQVELDLTERLAVPVVDRLDAVIRVGELADSSLFALKLAPHRRLLVASPHYLERSGTPDSVAALLGHRLLDKMRRVDVLGWSDLLGAPVAEAAGGQEAFRCDDFEALRAAALADFGVALLPSWVVGQDVANGALVSLLPRHPALSADHGGIYLLRALASPTPNLAAFAAALRGVIGSPPIWDRCAEVLQSRRDAVQERMPDLAFRSPKCAIPPSAKSSCLGADGGRSGSDRSDG
jgi:DNA-binding transcriptional LysR family regulator